MAGFYGQFINTVGMEYETTALNREFVADKVMRSWMNVMGDAARHIKVTRDASIEFVGEWMRFSGAQTPLLMSIHTVGARKLGLGSGNTRVLGTELCIEPLEIPDLEALLYPMIYTLAKYGDYTSSRASVHYHFGFANNLRLLKNMLAICLFVEPVLYRIGGMGGTFRGSSNLAAYARPLLHSLAVPVIPVMTVKKAKRTMESLATQFPNMTASQLLEMKSNAGQPSPVAVEIDGKFVQVINPTTALQAKTIDEFWAAFGVNYPVGGTVKYHGARYHGCNFFAVASHGTMEFRHFNQSMNIPLLVALPKFLRGIVELATVMSKYEAQDLEIVPSNVEISTSDGTEIIHRLLSMCHAREIEHLPSDEEVALLLETLDQSHFQSLPESPVLCHITDFQLDAETAIRGNLKIVRNVLEPQHTDIHNVGQKLISIFE